MNEYVSIKNWSTFQHYTDRNPPWIKLYNSLLDDYMFTSLSPESKLLLIHLWLLASRTDNLIPYDEDWILAKTQLKQSLDLEPLLRAGFIVINPLDSTLIASCKHHAITSRANKSRAKTGELFPSKPKKCHRTGCKKMGTTYDYDDTSLIYWMCDDHRKKGARV